VAGTTVNTISAQRRLASRAVGRGEAVHGDVVSGPGEGVEGDAAGAVAAGIVVRRHA